MTGAADTLETKYVSFELETKELSDDGRISGYASIYNNVDHGADIVMPGAFKSAFAAGAKMPKMLWQHDSREVIGVWDKLEDSERGVKISGRILKEIRRGAEAHALMKNGAIDGLSIGYITRESDTVAGKKGAVRQIKAADLLEVSVVTFPMNPLATVTDVKQLQSPREVEAILRSAGVPATFAKLVAIHGYDEAKNRLLKDQRDAGARDTELQEQFDALLTQIRSLKETMKNG